MKKSRKFVEISDMWHMVCLKNLYLARDISWHAIWIVMTKKKGEMKHVPSVRRGGISYI